MFVGVAALAILVGLVAQQFKNRPVNLPQFEQLVILPTPKTLGPVNFTDHNNEAFTAQNFANKWTILFFAFTNCPDICPSTLHTMKTVKQDLVKAGVWSQFQLAMVTVDPARDSTERLKQYVPFFDTEFIGLRADEQYTSEFAKSVGILFFKGETLENGGYDVDHGAALILINPQGEFAGAFNAPHTQNVLTADFIKLGKYAAATQPAATVTANRPAKAPITPATQSVNNGILTIQDAWIRPAPPNAPALAGYMKLTNTQKLPIKIVDVRSLLFGMSMIHQTKIEDGVASMVHMDGLKIAPGESVELKPMGTHLMLMRPKQSFARGSQIPLSLVLESGQVIDVTVEVRDNPAAE